jgi:hypothetical protein
MERHTKPSPDVPKWSALLVEAVNKPGLIMDACSALHNYSNRKSIARTCACHSPRRNRYGRLSASNGRLQNA